MAGSQCPPCPQLSTLGTTSCSSRTVRRRRKPSLRTQAIITERLPGEHVGLTLPRPGAPTQPIQTSCTHIWGEGRI